MSEASEAMVTVLRSRHWWSLGDRDAGRAAADLIEMQNARIAELEADNLDLIDELAYERAVCCEHGICCTGDRAPDPSRRYR